MEPQKTIAIIECNGRTYYFDIMPDFTFAIHFEEFKHFRSKSFKTTMEEFENIAKNKKERIQLL